MIRCRGLAALFFLLYFMVLIPFTGYLRSKPFVEKLGYIPHVEVLRVISADQKQSVAAGLIMKVLVYFGSLVEKNNNKIIIPPDYFGMFKVVDTAVRLDPYNMDGYYFAQAILVWDVAKVKEANDLLEYGMKFRTWDFYLPFFAGFNYAYFLKDYNKAAVCYQRAGELSGAELYQRLAGRYLLESGQTDLAIAYLATMEKGAKNNDIRMTFRTRLAAFREVKRIEVARDRYEKQFGQLPRAIADLQSGGFLSPPLVDPYGGTFFLDENGKVKTTSKFAYGAGQVKQ